MRTDRDDTDTGLRRMRSLQIAFVDHPRSLLADSYFPGSFVDQSVTAGETYFYVATAWDGTKESGFSNQVTAAVP